MSLSQLDYYRFSIAFKHRVPGISIHHRVSCVPTFLDVPLNWLEYKAHIIDSPTLGNCWFSKTVNLGCYSVHRRGGNWFGLRLIHGVIHPTKVQWMEWITYFCCFLKHDQGRTRDGWPLPGRIRTSAPNQITASHLFGSLNQARLDSKTDVRPTVVFLTVFFVQ